MSVRVKICGVTRVEDARLAVELGAEYLGVNFYPPSPRCVDAATARRIREAVGERARLVGVFVDRPADEIAELADRCDLDLVQLHGDETPEDAAHLAPRAIKALRLTGAPTAAELAPWRACWGLLFDTPHERLYGGSGEGWPYERAASAIGEGRIFVAGGIRPDNVERVVESIPGLFAVDVCSGVESRPGVKDRALMEGLFARLHHPSEERHG